MTDKKVSILCACKDRAEGLNLVIHSWIFHEQVHEVIVIDWSSKKSLNYLTKISEKVKVVTVKNEKYFNMPQPLNLALSIAEGDHILIMSSDYLLNTYPEYNFFKFFDIDDESYFCGEISGYNQNEEILVHSHFLKYLRGALYVKKDHLLKIGGYDESFGKYYGNDDGEIENRLNLLGLKKITFDNANCYSMIHLPHSNKKRYENFESYHEDKSDEIFLRDWLSTRYFSEGEIEWNFEYLMANRHIVKGQEFAKKIKNQEIEAGHVCCGLPELDTYVADRKTKWRVEKLSDQIIFAEKVEE
jgi:hypothetical protein